MTSTPAVEESNSNIAFPSMETSADSNPESIHPSDSKDTSSSKLTSSDKLSELPGPPTPNTNRRLLSPVIAGRSRRVMDPSSSLPSLSSKDRDFYTAGFSPHLRNSVYPRASASEGSIVDESSMRVSFDSDPGSLRTMRSVKQASRGNRISDPTVPSPEKRDTLDTPRGMHMSRSPSPNHSRATSPFRAFQQWSAGLRSHHHPHSNEEPFIPIDPFQLKWRFPRIPCVSAETFSIITDPSDDSIFSRILYRINTFFTEILPRVIYLHILLRLPAMYFTRVARVFEDAEVSRPDIQRMIDASLKINGYHETAQHTFSPPALPSTNTANGNARPPSISLPFPEDWIPPLVSPALVRFKHSWEAFIDSLLREWKTLNVVSALLLSAILTMFQIPDAATDPVTRTAALISLVCALMSLSYGCMYIVRFGTMRSMFQASRWAEEARRTNTFIWWNVWVLLAMPAVWMSWSMLSFIVSILSFVWRTGSVEDPDERASLSTTAILGPRIAITGVFGIGMIYFLLIIRTLKRYGTHVLPAKDRRRGRERERSSGGNVRRREVPLEVRRAGDSISRRIRTPSPIGLGLKGFPSVELGVAIVKDEV